jgi:hypothetical protein
MGTQIEPCLIHKVQVTLSINAFMIKINIGTLFSPPAEVGTIRLPRRRVVLDSREEGSATGSFLRFLLVPDVSFVASATFSWNRKTDANNVKGYHCFCRFYFQKYQQKKTHLSRRLQCISITICFNVFLQFIPKKIKVTQNLKAYLCFCKLYLHK